jgi:ABC-type dipeptide/oligopeptide/nickel transport system ATPase subunit
MPVSVRPVVKIAHVSKIFGKGPSAVHVLVDINLTINTGGVVGLIGPSGSGPNAAFQGIQPDVADQA